jgi:hypothetical protein
MMEGISLVDEMLAAGNRSSELLSSAVTELRNGRVSEANALVSESNRYLGVAQAKAKLADPLVDPAATTVCDTNPR